MHLRNFLPDSRHRQIRCTSHAGKISHPAGKTVRALRAWGRPPHPVSLAMKEAGPGVGSGWDSSPRK